MLKNIAIFILQLFSHYKLVKFISDRANIYLAKLRLCPSTLQIIRTRIKYPSSRVYDCMKFVRDTMKDRFTCYDFFFLLFLCVFIEKEKSCNVMSSFSLQNHNLISNSKNFK